MISARQCGDWWGTLLGIHGANVVAAIEIGSPLRAGKV